MSFLSLVFTYYLKASIHVGLAIVGLLGVWVLKLEISISYSLFLFVFSATIFSYNLIKHSRAILRSDKVIMGVNLCCMVGLIASFHSLDIKTQVVSVCTGAITLFYSYPFGSQVLSFRDRSGIKIFIVSLCWSLVAFVLPILESDREWNLIYLFLFIQCFLWVLVTTLPFEIRDLSIDANTIQTIPQKWGISHTKKIGFFLMVIFTALGKFLFVDIVIAVGVVFFVWKSQEHQSKYYASFWVESLPILWLGLTLMDVKL